MARKKNDTTMVLGIALVAYAILSMKPKMKPKPRFTPNPAFPNLPAEPPKGTPDWVLWVNGVTQIAGGLTAALFGPGGPFAGMTVQEVIQGSRGVTEGVKPDCFDPWGMPTSC